MRKKEFLRGIEGVVAGGVATVNGETNRRVHRNKIFYTESGTLSDPSTTGISRITERVNGVLMTDLTPAQARSIYLLNGGTLGTGEIPLPKSEPWRASVTGEEATSWDLFGQNSYHLGVQFDAAATVPAIRVMQEHDTVRNLDNGQPFKAIVKHLPISFNAVSGINDLNTLPFNFPIQRIHLFAASAIDDVEVLADGTMVYEGTDDENTRMLADYGLDGSQMAYPIVFDMDQQASNALNVRNSLNIRVNSSAAQTITAIVEQRVPNFI
jgi:hypothetical protein